MDSSPSPPPTFSGPVHQLLGKIVAHEDLCDLAPEAGVKWTKTVLEHVLQEKIGVLSQNPHALVNITAFEERSRIYEKLHDMYSELSARAKVANASDIRQNTMFRSSMSYLLSKCSLHEDMILLDGAAGALFAEERLSQMLLEKIELESTGLEDMSDRIGDLKELIAVYQALYHHFWVPLKVLEEGNLDDPRALRFHLLFPAKFDPTILYYRIGNGPSVMDVYQRSQV